VRALLATLGALLLSLPLILAAPAARADEPESWARISIDAITPALPDRDSPDQQVTISGRITNTSDIELSNLQVVYWRSLDPIETAEGMADALESDSNEPLGARAQGGSIYANVPSESDRTLAPDESTTFTLSATLAELELPDIDGIYLVGVHLRGRTDPVGPDITVGRGRIFLPVVSDEPAQKVRQTSVVVLTSRPSLLRTGVFLDDHLVEELSGQGRLTRLLQAARAAGTSFAVDPALVQEVQTMVGGYRVRQADGSTREGTGAAAARSWLAQLTELIRVGDGYRLPYANPDIAALVHHDLTGALADSVKAGASISATSSLPLLILPGNGTADEETVRVAAKLDPAAILMSDATLRTKTDSPVLEGPDGAPLVRYTAGASGGGPGPPPRNTPAKVQQRMLSDTWIAAKSAAEGSPAGRVRLVTEPSQSAGADNEVSAPWFTAATLTQLLDARPVAWSGEYRYTDNAAEGELSSAQLNAAGRLSGQFDIYADLLVDPTSARTEATIALPRSVSLSWRDDAAGSRRYTAAVQDNLTEILTERITISVTSKVRTTGRTGTFPITVRNELPAGADPDTNAIKVRIVFSSATSQRLTVDPLEIPPIPARQSITENAQVEAQTNGTVQVRAWLETEDGSVVGRPKTIQVNATQAGTTGWLIAIAAGIVLVGTTALRIRQVSRERARQEPGPDPLPVSRPVDGDSDEVTRDSLDV
ncbi:MAG TPA: DUF6049 family protein, partial [Microlunatus sp.]|nr:DUF6049 family protein [Microlunatus sp.]